MIRFLSVLVIACFLNIPLNEASASDRSPQQSLRSETFFHVNQDGTFDCDRQVVIGINNQADVNNKSQRRLAYNASLETAEIVAAYTLKQDGHIANVTNDQILELSDGAGSELPFSGIKQKVIIFPDVSIGDRLILHYRIHRHAPQFTSHFHDLEKPEPDTETDNVIHYDMPALMRLYSDAVGYTLVTRAQLGDRTVYEWKLNGSAPRPEIGSVSPYDDGPRLAISTFATMADFARAYQGPADEKSQPTTKIKDLALELTKGLSTEREKAIALSDWTRKNVRYVAVYVGVGNVVPHSAENILNDRFGDCKDHVALLQALLTSVNIYSTPALINLGTAHKIPLVPTLGILNHVITYIPSLDLFLDSTAQDIPGGMLHPAELDKPVLLTRTETLSRTPPRQDNVHKFTESYVIHLNGNATYHGIFVSPAWEAGGIEKTLASGPGDRTIQETFRRDGLRSNIRVRSIGPAPLGGVSVDSGGIVYDIFDDIEHTEFRVPSSGFGGIRDVLEFIDKVSARTRPFLCPSGDFIENTEYTVPFTFGVSELPKDVEIQDGPIFYRARYQTQLDRILVERVFEFRHPSAVCEAAEYAPMKDTIGKIFLEYKRKIRLVKKQ